MQNKFNQIIRQTGIGKISAIFILLSAAGMFMNMFIPGISRGLGLHSMFFEQNQFLKTFIQLLSFQFLHGNIMHFVFNSIFLYYFGTLVEKRIGSPRYLSFFFFSTIINGLLLLFFSSGTVIGISGFCMALISYQTMYLYKKRNPEYKGGITALVLNIGIGLYPGISLLGHLFGAISGVLFYLISEYKK